MINTDWQEYGFELDEDDLYYDFRKPRVPVYPGFEQHPSIHPTSCKESRLKYASYTDDRFRKAQVVYLDGSPEDLRGLSWDYSDRFRLWDREKANAACEAASASGYAGRTAGWAEAFLNSFYDGRVELKAIATGFNVSNGYDYYVYGYVVKGED